MIDSVMNMFQSSNANKINIDFLSNHNLLKNFLHSAATGTKQNWPMHIKENTQYFDQRTVRDEAENCFPFIEQSESLAEFQTKFATEEACAEALFKAKWPHGFECTRCGCPHMSKITTRRLPLFECKNCSYQASLLTGTVMQGSRTDLRKWFVAMFLFSRENNDLTAKRLQKTIHVTYKTAWLMMTKLRTAVHRAEASTKLAGKIRINHALHNKSKYSSSYHRTNVQPLLIGAQLDQFGQPAYVKLKQLQKNHIQGISVNGLGLRKFIVENICSLNQSQWHNIECVIKPFSRMRCPILKHIASAASIWINATFHGVSQKHLQKYLDEYCYRWNLITAGKSIFKSLFKLCCNTPAETYKKITQLSAHG